MRSGTVFDLVYCCQLTTTSQYQRVFVLLKFATRAQSDMMAAMVERPSFDEGASVALRDEKSRVGCEPIPASKVIVCRCLLANMPNHSIGRSAGRCKSILKILHDWLGGHRRNPLEGYRPCSGRNYWKRLRSV